MAELTTDIDPKLAHARTDLTLAGQYLDLSRELGRYKRCPSVFKEDQYREALSRAGERLGLAYAGCPTDAIAHGVLQAIHTEASLLSLACFGARQELPQLDPKAQVGYLSCILGRVEDAVCRGVSENSLRSNCIYGFVTLLPLFMGRAELSDSRLYSLDTHNLCFKDLEYHFVLAPGEFDKVLISFATSKPYLTFLMRNRQADRELTENLKEYCQETSRQVPSWFSTFVGQLQRREDIHRGQLELVR
jgi:hypothetical protein